MNFNTPLDSAIAINRSKTDDPVLDYSTVDSIHAIIGRAMDKEDDMIINRLPDIMDEKQISIRQLSRLTGITYTTVRALYHHERRSVQFEVMDAICHVLKVQPGAIFEYATQEGKDSFDSESRQQLSTTSHAEPAKVRQLNTDDSWITWE